MTGQQLTYDRGRRLIGWQSAPSNPTTTIAYAYDGEGNRVAQSVTSSGTTTTTDYIAKGLEEQTGSTLIKYETVPGVITAEVTGSGSSESVAYLATDGLGSVSEAVDGHGNVLGAQLYGPYGGVRYSSGTMPTARGYTGQYADAASGLDYYNARYYDAALGQFTAADSVQGPNRYAYVADNPETLTDPTGQVYACPHGCGSGGSGGCTQHCTQPTPTPTPPGNGKGDGGGSGTCTTKESCGRAKNDAYNALIDAWARDFGIGSLLTLGADLFQAYLDKSDVLKALRDSINLVGWIINVAPLLGPVLEHFGVGHWIEGVIDGLGKTANAAYGVLHSVNAWLEMWGSWGTALEWAGKVVNVFLSAAEGPIGFLVQEGIQIFGRAALDAGAAFGYYEMQKAQTELDAANTLLTEHSQTWCDTTPGACGHVTNW